MKNSKSTAAAATTVREQISASAPSIPVSTTPAPAALTVEHAGLQIDITSTTTDGTLAVYADQNLLFTTELHAGSAAEPVHLDRSLPAGPHQLRVALYRPDKSLLVQKEGLTDLRTESLNTLGIRVIRHKKLLLRRDDTLEVSWPGVHASPAAPAQNAPGPLSARSYSLH